MFYLKKIIIIKYLNLQTLLPFSHKASSSLAYVLCSNCYTTICKNPMIISSLSKTGHKTYLHNNMTIWIST